jgi:hypothetical protein
MAPGNHEGLTEKRPESQFVKRDLSRVYCNPWPKILDVPEKNRHPTAQWASRLVPSKVILDLIYSHLSFSASYTFLDSISQFFQPSLARTQVNSITGQTNRSKHDLASSCCKHFMFNQLTYNF